ncbi:hypothetical protein SpCBS45565_g06493 [Spizellomyces sp. 'palustris']|nr:hypothetical protein SpCBS45565_g06493 [Spizellomyces sp. 'palustris']
MVDLQTFECDYVSQASFDRMANFKLTRCAVPDITDWTVCKSDRDWKEHQAADLRISYSICYSHSVESALHQLSDHRVKSFFTGGSIKPAQREKIKQFVGFTNANDKTAQKFLKDNNWNLEAAVDAFFATGGATANGRSWTGADQRKLSALFDKYKDPDEDAILVDGTESLCNDLEVDPTDVVTLVLAWHLQSPRMCDFRRKGWMEGWTNLGCDTIEKMREVIPSLREELKDPSKFRDVYNYTFNFARAENQKSLGLDTAIAFWELLLKDKFKHLDLWVEFLREKHGKAISKDTWNLLLEFIRTSDENFSNHDTDSAWPVLIDSFVEYAREKLGFEDE